MIGQIVEIQEEGRRLSLERGFLVVSTSDGPLGRVPLDDIEAVILSHPAATFSSQVVAALAERGAPFVISGPDFKPAAYVLPVDGHYAQGDRIEAQAEAGLPIRKRLWADLVCAKIEAQADVLELAGIPSSAVRILAGRVRSGDSDNCEALAAQRYFPLLFGKGFFRQRHVGGANAFLNYGYTILRAATARAIVASGLHPSLSIQHRSKGNALRLADDLMEPFRPSVDLIARQLDLEGILDLDPLVKRRLAAVLRADFQTEEGIAPLSNVLARLCVSLAQVYSGERRKLILPRSRLPIPRIGSP